MKHFPIYFILAGMGLSVLTGCGAFSAKPLPLQKTPPLKPAPAGVFREVNPRFSHDGRRVAFVRLYPDRTQSVFTAEINPQSESLTNGLQNLRQETEPEIVCPDRPYSPERNSLFAPDTLAWTPDDSQLIFTRAAWFDFGKEMFPGTDLWTLHLQTRSMEPIATHPKKYSGIFQYYKNPVIASDGKRLAFTGESMSGQRAIFVRNFALNDADEVPPRFDKYADSDAAIWEPGRSLPHQIPSLLFRQGIRRAAYTPLTETIRRMRPALVAGIEQPKMETKLGELWRISTRQAQQRLQNGSEQSVIPRIGQISPAPNGAKIAFVLTPDALDLNRAQVWLMGKNGENAKRVSSEKMGAFSPIWLNSETLTFVTPTETGFILNALSLKTGKTKKLTDLATADFDLSPDGTKIISAQTSSSNGTGVSLIVKKITPPN